MTAFSSPNSNISTTRLSRKWLLPARIAWGFLLLLVVAKIALGRPLRYAEMSQPCLADAETCNLGDALTLEQARILEQTGFSLANYAQMDLAWAMVNLLVWGGIGIFIFILRSDDLLAWLASAMMISYNSSGLETQIIAAHPALAVPADLIFALSNVLLFLFIALFPNGRFAPRWMRWYWLVMVLFTFVPRDTLLTNPDIANMVIVIYWISFLILAPYSLIHRYRSDSSTIERLQTKWVVFGFALFAGGILSMAALTAFLPVNSLFYILVNAYSFDLFGLLIPLGIGFSVLRYRLWEVDLLIRRTLQYTLLSGLLALAYFGGVVVLQSLVKPLTGQTDSPLVAVLTTLGVAALFNPLRWRVQEFIDRRFYRQKYDAEKALAAFAAAARSETDLEQLTAQLTATVQETLQPEQVSLWITQPARQPVENWK